MNLTNPNAYFITPQKIRQIISESFVPTTPEEKSDQLLFLLNKIFPFFEGEIMKSSLFKLSFFKNFEEFSIYFDYLLQSEFILVNETLSTKRETYSGKSRNDSSLYIRLKYNGINRLVALEQNGRNSRNCFVAMSFSEGRELEIKEAIKAAINETNYNPIIINEQHFESDRTINDEIIAGIKKAKFVISDFTEQKPNVYFEAGFALGLGLPVIYCCEKEDFDNNSQFDVNHYPHILYKTPEQLRKGLIDKIRAWID